MTKKLTPFLKPNEVLSDTEVDFLREKSDNPLICLNNALSNEGFFIEVEKNYKLEKVVIIYNIFK